MNDATAVTAQSELEAAFGLEMHRTYERALSEARYKASRFLDMLYDRGGLRTARYLLHASAVSDGYTALWERGHMNLTVEAVIYENPKWHPLFTADELAICVRRLTEYGYLKG